MTLFLPALTLHGRPFWLLHVGIFCLYITWYTKSKFSNRRGAEEIWRIEERTEERDKSERLPTCPLSAGATLSANSYWLSNPLAQQPLAKKTSQHLMQMGSTTLSLPPAAGEITRLALITRGDVRATDTYLIFLPSSNDVIYFSSKNNTHLSFPSIK